VIAGETQRVLVIDDDAMARSWIQLALEGSEFAVTGAASSAGETLDLIERRRPQLLLVDYRLPDTVGTELLRDLRQQGIATPAVLMTANLERGFNEAASEAGAQGSVLKSGRSEDLLHALRSVVAGRESFDARHPKRDPARGALSPRERDVLRRVAAGATNREIAAELGVGDETVKTLMARIFSKLGVRKRAEAVAEAHNLGLL
jgi:DNA-binding NarL/FixJ family response regulator